MNSTPPDTPIVAVTVYPDGARVTRRGIFTLAPGEHQVGIGPLPLGLRTDSLRVAGRGPATVLGVDVRTRHQPRTTDSDVVELTRRRDEIEAELAGLADTEAVDSQRVEFLSLLAQRAGGSYARTLATGDVTPTDVAAFTDSIADQLLAVKTRQRGLARERGELRDRLAAIDRELGELTGKRQPDQLVADVTVAVTPTDGDGEIELELSYVVNNAGWKSSYDVRLTGQQLTLTWLAMVSQRTGEDWPECELLLSTARPSVATTVPELDPWYLDRVRPVPNHPPQPGGPPPPRGARGVPLPGRLSGTAAVAAETTAAPAAPAAAPVAVRTATVEHGVAAATYRPARPVAVPADGGSHRVTVVVMELPVRLDHVTAPVRAAEAYLRATVTNGSPHTLLSGPASVFHGADFVGTTRLPVWAPGEETELALGLDNRVRVERELVRRADTRATLGSTRRREMEYRLTVANHTGQPARVTVLDQLPVSRNEGITVRELRLEPAPTDRSELGELSWRLELPPGGSGEVRLGWRVELAKGVELAGWRE